MEYKIEIEEVYQNLESIVGSNYIKKSLYERISYASDPMPYDLRENNIPDIVVKPANAQEVSQILKYANEHRIPVVPHGSGTSLHGNARPKRKGIVLSMSRINHIYVDENYMYLKCGAGATCIDVKNQLEKKGYFLPMYPGSLLSASMGGLVAANTIGHMVDSVYGKPINNVLGLEVVLPTGEILKTGTDSLRRPAGIDLTRFFVGSEGLFGVITEIKMALVRKPCMAYVMGVFKNLYDIGKAWMRVYREKIPLPIYGEFLDQKTAEHGFKMRSLEPPEGPISIATAVGNTEEAALNTASRIADVFEHEGAIRVRILESKEEQEKIWGTRDFIMHLAEGGGGVALVDCTVALPHLADAMREIERAPEKVTVFKNLPYYAFGHVGSLDLHGMWIVPKDMPDEDKRRGMIEVMEKVDKEMNLRYEACGGEWGQMTHRVPFFKAKYGEVGYSLLKALKRTFDPNNILNPGNLEGEL
jgi:glycolate oxidase